MIEFELGQAGDDNTYEGRVTVSGKDSVMLMVRDISLYKRFQMEREAMIDELEKDTPDLEAAVRSLASNPALRNRLIEIKKSHEQVIDESPDDITSVGFDSAATERARVTVESFKAFLAMKPDADERKDIEAEIEDLGGAP